MGAFSHDDGESFYQLLESGKLRFTLNAREEFLEHNTGNRKGRIRRYHAPQDTHHTRLGFSPPPATKRQ